MPAEFQNNYTNQKFSVTVLARIIEGKKQTWFFIDQVDENGIREDILRAPTEIDWEYLVEQGLVEMAEKYFADEFEFALPRAWGYFSRKLKDTELHHIQYFAWRESLK